MHTTMSNPHVLKTENSIQLQHSLTLVTSQIGGKRGQSTAIHTKRSSWILNHGDSLGEIPSLSRSEETEYRRHGRTVSHSQIICRERQ